MSAASPTSSCSTKSCTPKRSSPSRDHASRRTVVGMSNATSAVVVDGVSKVYGPAGSHTFALDRLSLDVREGEFCCLVGASGCGKTTLLNLIAGVDRPQAGTIRASGKVALLFQDAALFPWLTATQNIELALRLRGVA